VAKGFVCVGLVEDQEVQVDKNITSVACVFLRLLNSTVLNENYSI